MSSFSVLKVNDLESINKKRFAIIINVFVLINSDYFSTKKEALRLLFFMAGPTRLELATSCVTGRHSNQTELRSHLVY